MGVGNKPGFVMRVVIWQYKMESRVPFRVKVFARPSESTLWPSLYARGGDEPACAHEHELCHPHRRRSVLFKAFNRGCCLARRILELESERYTTTPATRSPAARTSRLVAVFPLPGGGSWFAQAARREGVRARRGIAPKLAESRDNA